MTRHPQALNVPHDIAAEASVLGGIVFRNEILTQLPRLGVEDFFSPAHQAVFIAIRNLEAKAAPLDAVTLGGELERMGRFEAIGGFGGLGVILSNFTSSENTLHYAKILEGHRLSRDVLKAVLAVAEDIRTGQVEGEEALRLGIAHLMAVQSRKPDPGRTVGQLMRAELAAIGRDMQTIGAGGIVSHGISTGVDLLDRHTGGYPVGSVSVILGATGHGKSTLIGCGARASSADRDLALVYSLEDPAKFWGQRGLAQESGIPTEQIVRRRDGMGAVFGIAEGERLARAIPAAAKRTEVIIPASQWTADEIIRDVQMRRAKDTAEQGKRRRCSVWVDYVQVVRLLIAKNSNREQGIAHAMDRFSWLAQGCGSADSDDECAVIVGSQVKQIVIDDKRPPRINDGADSFSIAKVSKFMVGINRPAKYDDAADPTLGSIDVLKRNQGDDEVHADVELDLATHSIRARATSNREPPPDFISRHR